MFVIANNDLDNVADKVLEVLTALANGAKRIDKDVDVGFLRNHSWWYNPPKKLRGLLCWKQSIKYLQSFFWYFQPKHNELGYWEAFVMVMKQSKAPLRFATGILIIFIVLQVLVGIKHDREVTRLDNQLQTIIEKLDEVIDNVK